jgi:hypothetical protein
MPAQLISLYLNNLLYRTPLFGERLQQAREEKKFNIFEKQLIAEGVYFSI